MRPYGCYGHNTFQLTGDNTRKHLPLMFIQSDSKLLSGFLWPINGHPVNDVESFCTCHPIQRALVLFTTVFSYAFAADICNPLLVLHCIYIIFLGFVYTVSRTLFLSVSYYHPRVSGFTLCTLDISGSSWFSVFSCRVYYPSIVVWISFPPSGSMYTQESFRDEHLRPPVLCLARATQPIQHMIRQ
jgi:hypothetical protein